MLRTILLAFCCFPLLTDAAPGVVERFDAQTWARLQKELPRPSVVVFTATYCANCPAVIESVAQRLTIKKLKREVVAVVVDESDPQELLKSPHYQLATRLFAFDDSEATLRFGVNPRWRGETPYLALLSENGDVIFVLGTPSDAQFDTWLRH